MQQKITEVLSAAPPLAAGSLVLFGVPLASWVLMLTAVYTIFLIIDKAPVIIDRLLAFGYFISRLWTGEFKEKRHDKQG
jgi:hypothetical protein